MSETRKRFLSQSLMAYAIDLVVAVLAFVCGVLIARTLGPAGQGRYAVLILLPMITQRFMNLGLGPGMVHGVARDPDSAPVRSVNAILATFLLGGLGAAGALIASRKLAIEEMEVLEATGSVLLALVIAGLLYANYSRSISVGLDKIWRRNLMVLINPLVRLTMLGVLVIGLGMGIRGAVRAWILGIGAEALLGFAFLAPAMWRHKPRPNHRILLGDLRFGIQVHAATVIGFMLYRFDLFLVAYFLEPKHVGHYAAAVTLVMPLAILPQAIRAVFLPKVTARFKEIGARERMTPMVTRVLLAISTVIAGVCGLVAGPAIRLLYGEAYAPSVLPFLVLLPAVTLMATITVLNSSLQARRGQRWTLVAALMGLAVNIVLDVLLIPRFGIFGAAIASSIAYFCTAFALIKFFLRLVPGMTARELLVVQMDDVRSIYRSFRP